MLRLGSAVLAQIPSGQLGSSPAPFVALMLLGMVVGAIGHVFGSRLLVGGGIAMVFAAVLGLPILVYLSQ